MPRRRLSERQIQRIQTIQERRRQHLADRAERALDAVQEEQIDEAGPRAGRVVVRHGANLAVEDSEGRIHHCLARRNIGHPVCGDRVVWQATADDQGVVTAIQPRETVLSRPDYGGRDKPLAANLTRLVVLIAPEPDPSGYLVDQYLAAAELLGVQALIVANKMDLLDEPAAAAFRARFALYPAIGYPILWTSLRQPETLPALIAALADQTSILVGQSGVGKSSLVQTLLPDLDIQIGRLSKATGLGRHTTSTATCYRLIGGGFLIDSPGVRSFRLGTIDRETLQRGFREFGPHLGGCRFADCHHDHEPGCAIRAAVDAGQIAPARLANFHHLAAGLGPAWA
ncbi:MAG TPA: ribosome small subunit-dependent GTPase A [Lamprocystis sp. (in: g-proteobacteria)]|nr:ribosome small subunit-dependent GTPase A [Lamprocystis sp. (in: g-proteobacteria)]